MPLKTILAKPGVRKPKKQVCFGQIMTSSQCGQVLPLLLQCFLLACHFWQGAGEADDVRISGLRAALDSAHPSGQINRAFGRCLNLAQSY